MSFEVPNMVKEESCQHVVEQIQTAIQNKEFKHGENLPSEVKLKEMFNTSQRTIREAIKVLEEKGFIMIRGGDQRVAIIKRPNTETNSDSMAMLIRDRRISLKELAEYRELLEGYAAEQAASKGSEKGFENLKQILIDIHAHIHTDPQEWTEFQRLVSQFHYRLAKMAENPLIVANLEIIHENIHDYFNKYLSFSKELLEEGFEDLCEIFIAVKKGDSSAAGIIARQHVAKFTHIMEVEEMEVEEDMSSLSLPSLLS